MSKHTDRESWLKAALSMFETEIAFPRTGATLPDVRVSCGFPRGSRGNAVGYTYAPNFSADGTCECFISPTIADPVEALAAVWSQGIELLALGGTRRTSALAWRAVAPAGIAPESPSRNAKAAEHVNVWRLMAPAAFDSALAALGEYPHATFASAPKCATRLLKLEHECGWTVRASSKQAKLVTPESPCPACLSTGDWILEGCIVGNTDE